MSLRPIAAAALVLAAAIPSRPAAACTCKINRTHVLSPQPGWSVAPDEAIATTSWVAPERVVLIDDDGQSVPMEPEFLRRGFGLCAQTYGVWRPADSPPPNRRYRLEITDPEFYGKEAFPPLGFTVRDQRPLLRRARATVTVEHDPHEPALSDEAGCADPRINGELVLGSFALTLTVDAPSLLVLTGSAEDAKFGKFETVSATLGRRDRPTRFHRVDHTRDWLPVLPTTSPCVDFTVRDYDGAPLWTKRACPAPGQTLTFDQEIEHRVTPDGPREPDIDVVEPGGCAIAARPRHPMPSAGLELIALLAVAVGRFRRSPLR